MKKKTHTFDPAQLGSLLSSLTTLTHKNGLDRFYYQLSSRNRVSVQYQFNELEEDKEREIFVEYGGRRYSVYVIINIHYIYKITSKTKMTLEETLKVLYAKYSLQALMGLYNTNDDFPNLKLRELACNLEINWKMDRNDEDFFPRAYMFGLEEYKSWRYYYKALESMLADNEDNFDLDLYPSGKGKPSDNQGEGENKVIADTDVVDSNDKNQNEDASDGSKEISEDVELQEGEYSQEQSFEQSKTPDQLKLEKFLEKFNEIDDQIEDSSEPRGNIFDDDLQDIEKEIIKGVDKSCESELDKKKIQNLKIEKFHKLIQELTRKERQVRITQTRKIDSYHRVNNRREEKGLILPGKKTTLHGVQKKYAEQLDVFIDISGSTTGYIRQAEVCYIDIMNYVAKEFHDAGARIIFYNHLCNRTVKPYDLFIPAVGKGGTDILNVVMSLEHKEKSRLKRVIVFTDGEDTFNTLYDTHKDVQIYKFASNSYDGFKILKYDRSIDYFKPL